MATFELNLSRKWRSQNFEEVIGQDLVIRILKNSLYSSRYFPVYLFAGQRGCGKTSTARIFAAALNCFKLEEFQKDPIKTIVPCGVCKSCVALFEGRHNDFIEMDAASHTGVDNMRQLIDDALLLPVLGTKRIYLIDEAHMLSNAAFNALLKILEEPPSHVVFILATTDPHKIIDTVKSRCFQLFFKSIEQRSLTDHLVNVCIQEQIVYDQEGLEYIVGQSHGSARDALNMLEQVRFSDKGAIKQEVLEVLGRIDDTILIELLRVVFAGDPIAVMAYIEQNVAENILVEFVWDRCIALLRDLLWLSAGVMPMCSSSLLPLLKELISTVSYEDIQCCMHLFYTHELIFLRTQAQRGLFELVLIECCKKKIEIASKSKQVIQDRSVQQPTILQSVSAKAPYLEQTSVSVKTLSGTLTRQGVITSQKVSTENLIENKEYINEGVDNLSTNNVGKWKQFLILLENNVDDTMLFSFFSQIVSHCYDLQAKKLVITFLSDHVFFKDVLEQQKDTWLPLLQQVFGINDSAVILKFDGNQKLEEKKKSKNKEINALQEKKTPIVEHSAIAKKTINRANQNINRTKKLSNLSAQILDVSEKDHWKKTQIVLKYFTGTVYSLNGDTHE
jgi:DNA polymerase-3 subunit gamma/tau